MESRQEILGIELERTIKGFSYRKTNTIPLRSSDENTSIDSLNDLRLHRTAETGAQQSRKPLTTTSTQMRALVRGKENVESGSTRARSSLSSFKPKKSAGFLGITDIQKLQEVSNKPLSRRELNVLDEAGGKPDVSSHTIPPEYRGGLAAAFMEGSQGLHSQRRHLNRSLEEFVCSKPDCMQKTIEHPLTVLVQERIQGTPCDPLQSTESLKAPLFTSTESMEAPLLSQFQDRSENEILCVHVRDENTFSLTQWENISGQCSETAKALLDQSKTEHIESSCELLECSMASQSQCNQDSRTCEESNTDHVVVFFSVQKFLQENASEADRHKLLKLSSLCTLYSRKFLCWATRVYREQNITNCLRRIRQIFSPSTRGFVELNSHKLPEFSTQISSPSKNKKQLANDNELRAVLLKINEVLASMETTTLNAMQEGASHGEGQ